MQTSDLPLAWHVHVYNTNLQNVIESFKFNIMQQNLFYAVATYQLPYQYLRNFCGYNYYC